MSQADNLIHMATIGAAHGTKGEIRLKSFTSDPAAIKHYKPLFDEHGNSYEITDLRPDKTVFVVRFKHVHTRNDAALLNGVALFVPRSHLPDDLLADEFYYSDLVGLMVQSRDGQELGLISGVFNFGAGELLEIKMPQRRPVLIPFTKDAVLDISLKDKRVVICRQASGLLDEGDKPQ